MSQAASVALIGWRRTRAVMALALTLLAAPAPAQSHKVEGGQTLARVAELHYGHRHYLVFVAKLNRIEWNAPLTPGQVLRVARIDDALRNDGLPQEAQSDIEQVLKARYTYIRHRDTLVKAIDPGNSKGKIQIPADVRVALTEAATALETAGKELARKGNWSDSPTRMRQRLESCAKSLRQLAAGAPGVQDRAKLEDSVHRLFAQAFVFGLKWARGEDGNKK